MSGTLNHIYRLIWNHVQQAWMVVSEVAKSQGKKTSLSSIVGRSQSLATHRFKFKTLAVLSGLMLSPIAHALPEAIVATHGSLTTTVDGSNMYITQHSKKLVGYTNDFDIASGESVSLYQPKGGMALIRVVGNSPTEIYGHLTATGKLFLINESGILFGESSQVSVGSIVASSLNISDNNFLRGKFKFSAGETSGNVINQGTIKAANEGYVVLLGKTVENTGTLVADRGSVVMASAKVAELDFFGNGLVKTKLSGNALEAVVKNSGRIQANGGIVQMATNGRSAAINVSGIVEANSLVERNGVIRLEGGDDSKVEVSGQLIAKGEGTKGGKILVTAEQVALTGNALVDVTGSTDGGTILIGGDYQGKNASVYNARTTFVGKDVVLKADAGIDGDGGKVILWADSTTKFFGTISAQAGTQSGNGGFVEVSGESYLKFAGNVDLKATNGKNGTLLLDPENIILTNSDSDSNTSGFNAGTDNLEYFTDDAGLDSTFDVGANGSFKGVSDGAYIILQAKNNITVESEFNVATATGHDNVNLSLNANNNIYLNANVSTTGSGSIAITADSDLNGSGDLYVNSDVHTEKGNLALYGNSVYANANTISTLGGNVLIGGKALIELNDVKINTYDALSDKTGGNVIISTLQRGGDIVISGEINTINPSASGDDLVGGNGGNVLINASDSLTLKDTTINASRGEAATYGFNFFGTKLSVAGNVVISANYVNYANGNINTHGGNVLINAFKTLNLGTTQINTFSTSTDRTGGNVFVTGLQGLKYSGVINTVNPSTPSEKLSGGYGGNVLIYSDGDVDLADTQINVASEYTNSIMIPSGGKSYSVSGNVAIYGANVNMDSGSINTNGQAFTSGADVNLSGNVSINAKGAIDLGTTTIDTSGSTPADSNGVNAGNIELVGASVSTTGNISANGSDATSVDGNGGNAGDVYITAKTGNVVIGRIDANGGTANGSGVDGDGGDILVRAAGELKLTGNITTNSNTDTAVQLVGQSFNNAANASIITGDDGRWLVYSSNPANDIRGSNLLATYDFKQYNSKYGDTVKGSGNGFIYTIAPKITVGANGYPSKVFDGTTTATGYTLTSSGAIDGDSINLTSTSANYDNINVGTNKTVTIDGIGMSAENDGKPVYGYTLDNNTATTTGEILAQTDPPVTPIDPRDIAGLVLLTGSNPVLNSMTIVSLNPAAGDDDPDYVPCPTVEDRLGSTPILNSGVKLPEGVLANCI